MTTSLSLAASGSWTLSQAILVYAKDGEHGRESIATIHPAAGGVVGPGRYLTHENLTHLIQSLSVAEAGEYLPENVISRSTSRIVWWSPSQLRRIWFNAGELESLNGRIARHPALLFDVRSNHSLHVFALADSARPTPATRLYHAPYQNVHSDGSVALCNARPPRESSSESIPKWERSFYDSAFNHSHGGTSGLLDIWTRLSADPQPDTLDVPATCKPGATLDTLLRRARSDD